MFGFKKSQQSRLEGALKKLETGHSAEAMTELRRLAQEGYAEAEYRLGEIHEFRLKDLHEAAGWYRRAAGHGHAKSQWCMGNLYMTGIGTELDRKEALRWYHAAAENQIPEAQYALGEEYRVGQYVERNTDTALYWYQQSALAGCEIAEMRIRQFWPNGVFEDRSTVETSDKGPIQRSGEGYDSSASPLFLEIIRTARQLGYVPPDEVPFVPELLPYEQKAIDFVCGHINEDMKTLGLDQPQMIAVFRFVFYLAFDFMCQWHKSSDGKIDDSIIVGNPFDERFTEHQLLRLPKEVRKVAKSVDAPRIVYGIMSSWWAQHAGDLRRRGVDIWEPLTVALMATSRIAMSIALKMFGYWK